MPTLLETRPPTGCGSVVHKAEIFAMPTRTTATSNPVDDFAHALDAAADELANSIVGSHGRRSATLLDKDRRCCSNAQEPAGHDEAA
ncbi:MAG TPA: hypothetical protein VNE82_16555 [Candidatus Binataceae bacterium]|nr:hypothetical protein [Candidatus Binataceae bacterium]